MSSGLFDLFAESKRLHGTAKEVKTSPNLAIGEKLK